MQTNQAIFESLFNRNFSDTGNGEFLEDLTRKHPYFSPAQFYLLQQTRSGSPEFEQRVTRTNILFNNPHWLHLNLQEEAEPLVPLIMPPEPAVTVETPFLSEMPDDTEVTTENNMEAEIEPMKIALKMPDEKSIPSEAMLFEPMHMVDYFASQGIKLTDEAQMADKLGKQLKSFTEWLKTMKKVHIENEAVPGVETDVRIQTLAETSNTEAEVLTEAMAEVLARQGKLGKAGEVYKKLSLLNPAKSAYFAAKIENLKGI